MDGAPPEGFFWSASPYFFFSSFPCLFFFGHPCAPFYYFLLNPILGCWFALFLFFSWWCFFFWCFWFFFFGVWFGCVFGAVVGGVGCCFFFFFFPTRGLTVFLHPFSFSSGSCTSSFFSVSLDRFSFFLGFNPLDE